MLQPFQGFVIDLSLAVGTVGGHGIVGIHNGQ